MKTHTLTHKHDTLLLTQTVTTVHCTTRRAFATGSYELSEEIETSGTLRHTCGGGAVTCGSSEVVRVVDGRTLSQPILLVLNHCKFLYVSVNFLITSDYYCLLTRIKNQCESTLLSLLTDIRMRSALKVPKASSSFLALRIVLYVISGFRRKVNENCTLLAKDGTDRLSRNVGKELPLLAA